MKPTLKRMLGVSLVSLLLCAVTLAMPVATAVSAVSTVSPFDYGTDPAAEHEVLSADVLLDMLYDGEISSAESDYLKRLSGITMQYSDFVPASNITTYYDRDMHCLSITVQPYSYVANNGATVQWIPKEISFDGGLYMPVYEEGRGYTCTVENVLHTGDFAMDVRFDWTVTLPADAVESLLNRAYRAGSDALEEIVAHELLVKDYEARVEAYRKYVQYLEDKTNYENYCTAYAEYELQLAAYNAYLEEFAAYCEEKTLYDAWQNYFAYVDFLDNHYLEYQEYVQYRNRVEEVKKRLQPLESLFVWDSNGRQFYAALMGNLVTMVLEEENKKDLIAAGCTASDVHAAGVAAVALRELMEPYANLRKAKYASEHEKYTALYAYYTEHHAALTKHFSDLCNALNSLCDCSVLIINLDRENKLDHYRKFVGQLYVTATALDDSVKRDPNWTVNKKVWSTVVQECNIVPDDIVAAPSAASMPEVAVLPVKEVSPAEKPDGQPPREEPTAPDFVEEPVEPESVADPDLLGIPPVAEKPEDEAPAEPIMDAALRALAEEIRAGTLTLRNVADTPTTLTLQTTVRRSVSVDNRKQILFYAADRKTQICEMWVEYGSAFSADGIAATRPSDAQYHYTFDAWLLPDGSTPAFVAESDMTLIAHFTPELRSYTVTWILNTATQTVEVPYGTLPEAPYNLNPTPAVGHRYVFSGWSPSVEPVSGDVTYRATLTQVPILFTVTWNFGDRTETSFVEYGKTPQYTGDVSRAPDHARYEFEGWFDKWNHAPSGVTEDVTYTARYRRIPLATQTDRKTELTVTHTESAVVVDCASVSSVCMREAAWLAKEEGKSLTLQWQQLSVTVEPENLDIFLDASCERIDLLSVRENGAERLSMQYIDHANANKELALPVSVKVLSQNTTATVMQGDGWTSMENGTAEMIGSVSIQLKTTHKIDVSVPGNQSCNVTKIPVKAEVGAVIDLRVPCDPGYEVSQARVRTQDGTEILVENLTFVMPDADVTVELQITRIVYTVIFRVDGQVVLQKEYGLGATIELPATPQKPSDAQSDYTFKAWNPEPLTAIGDTRTMYFDAIFEASPVIKGNPYHSGRNNNFTLTVLFPIAAVLLVGGITAIVVLRKRKKKKANAQAKEQK